MDPLTTKSMLPAVVPSTVFPPLDVVVEWRGA